MQSFKVVSAWETWILNYRLLLLLFLGITALVDVLKERGGLIKRDSKAGLQLRLCTLAAEVMLRQLEAHEVSFAYCFVLVLPT